MDIESCLTLKLIAEIGETHAYTSKVLKFECLNQENSNSFHHYLAIKMAISLCSIQSVYTLRPATSIYH